MSRTTSNRPIDPSHRMTSEVEMAFDRIEDPARTVLLSARDLVLVTAAELPETGGVREYLAWGQPSYRPQRPGIGSAIRLGVHDSRRVALFVHCQTSLVDQFRDVVGHLEFSGRRAVLLEASAPLPIAELRLVIELALTYHRR